MSFTPFGPEPIRFQLCEQSASGVRYSLNPTSSQRYRRCRCEIFLHPLILSWPIDTSGVQALRFERRTIAERPASVVMGRPPSYRTVCPFHRCVERVTELICRPSLSPATTIRVNRGPVHRWKTTRSYRILCRLRKSDKPSCHSQTKRYRPSVWCPQAVLDRLISLTRSHRRFSCPALSPERFLRGSRHCSEEH